MKWKVGVVLMGSKMVVMFDGEAAFDQDIFPYLLANVELF